MRRKFAEALLCMALTLAGCVPAFIHDKEYMAEVREDLSSRSQVLQAAGICLDAMDLSTDERQALEFLYAYMPLGDIVNMPPEYYLEHYRLTSHALEEMPWGRSIPERELRHFVLPVRVNNESLDSARRVFQKELMPRVKHLSMYDAVLEVNHWCHEKAVYMPSDRRTSSPLATVRTAYGRCGEESTLLVSALRSVGIPARQVYTPRWAHTDSNHAWVEAWVDGRWYFLGACEPEPVLDLGWFNAPASRGMLMHTKVFGRYDGPEEIVLVTPNYTEINVIEHYAPQSASVGVTVTDREGRPVEGAKVDFKIYNYSEFNSVAFKLTDKDGKTSLAAGLGDMMIYASKDGRFGFSKVSCGKDEAVTIVLEYEEGSAIPHLRMEIVPPVENVRLPEVTAEQRAENTRRMEYEDSLRNAYVDTFFDRQEALHWAGRFNRICPDQDGRLADILVASRGNHPVMTSFISEAAGKNRLSSALHLLESLTEKDLRDTPKPVLDDHLYNGPQGECPAEYIYCPRTDTELLTPYRGYMQKNVPQSLVDSLHRDPALFVAWCRDNLALHDEMSLQYVQLDPRRVWETRLADKGSRDIFFVAVCRSFEVPAWMDPVTRVVKYLNQEDHKVYDVDFDAQEQGMAPTGRLQFNYDEIPLLDDPKYKTHFTLSKFVDGGFQLQNFNGTWASLFKGPKEMDCGYYMLVSGSRMSGGNVLADIQFFTIEEGRTATVDLVMRNSEDQLRVIGSFDSEMKYLALDGAPSDEAVASASEASVLSVTGRGYFAVVLADYGTEPTNHAFMDISAVASQLEEWGRPLLVIFASEEECLKFRGEHFNLPSTVRYGIDRDGSMRRSIASEMKLEGEGALPLILVADTFNRVVFFSQGYSIGLGERLVNTSKAL